VNAANNNREQKRIINTRINLTAIRTQSTKCRKMYPTGWKLQWRHQK